MFKRLRWRLMWWKVAWMYKQPWTGLFKLKLDPNGKPTGIVYKYYINDWIVLGHFKNPKSATRVILKIRYNMIKSYISTKRHKKPVKHLYFP